MDSWQDLYIVLQVHPDAEQDMIQNAYKKLCKKYHPDINPLPQAAEKIKRINAAYEVLGNEVRRRAYHLEWRRRNIGKDSFSPRAEARERAVYASREPPPSHGGTQAAYQVVGDYFASLSAGRFKEAFTLVSEADKKLISCGDFVEWRESVAAIYEIGGFDLRLFKRHAALKLSSEQGHKAEEYTVSISEKNKSTGSVRRYSFTKYAIFEGFCWKVYLGYRSLAPLMMQFRMMATTPEEAQIVGLWDKYRNDHDIFMGLPNMRGFEKSFETLAYTNKRYGREFTASVLRISLPGSMGANGKRELIIKYSGYILDNGIRCVDTAAYLGDDRFGLLLAETDKPRAALAVRRLLVTVRHDIAACFDFEPQIHAGILDYGGQGPDDTITKCLREMERECEENAPSSESEAL